MADELFVREGAAITPTARARKWLEGIQDGLQLLPPAWAKAVHSRPPAAGRPFTDFTSFELLTLMQSIASSDATEPCTGFSVMAAIG